jgi:hypothetical protein
VCAFLANFGWLGDLRRSGVRSLPYLRTGEGLLSLLEYFRLVTNCWKR